MARVIRKIRSSSLVSLALGHEMNADHLAAPHSEMMNILNDGSAGTLQASERFTSWLKEMEA
jgi:hypothetical protein